MQDNSNILDYQSKPNADPNVYLASSGKRLANFLLDRICFYLFFIALVGVFTPIMEGSDEDLSVIPALIILAFIPGYWVLFEFFLGKTPAKYLTKTKVVTKTGGRASFPQILGRTLCRFIPFEPFSFLGSKPVGWHDSISGTLVVDDRYQGASDELV